MRRSLLVLVSIFWILSSCKARQDASATKADISVGHTWWDNVVKVLNDTTSRTDQAKKGTDLLVDRVNEAKTNKVTAQRRAIQVQVEKSRTDIAGLVQQISTLLDTLKTTLAEGSTTDIQQGEKNIRNVPESRMVQIGSRQLDWGFRGISAEAERINKVLTSDILVQVRLVALRSTDDSEVTRSLAQINAIRASMETARSDIQLLNQGIRSWFDPSSSDFDGCSVAGTAFKSIDCKWRPAASYLRFIANGRPCAGNLNADQPGSFMFDQGQPSFNNQAYYKTCTDAHSALKDAVAQQFDWMEQNKTTQSFLDTRDGARKDLSILVSEMAKPQPSLSILITQSLPTIAYDYNTNSYSIPFSLLNGDIKQAFIDYFKIQAGASGNTNTGPIAAKPRVENWRPSVVEQEIKDLVAKPINDPATPFTDYRPDSPAGNLDLPGLDVLASMRVIATEFKTNTPGIPLGTPCPSGSNNCARDSCLTTGFSPTHWSDIELHFYCLLGEPRSCYTFATSGGKPRFESYEGCVADKDFSWVANNQAIMFRYMMFSQTRTFKNEQEQNIINEFYNVIPDKFGNIDPAECKLKRPRRTEDPTDGTHCLANKVMKPKLIGKSR